MTTSYPAVRGPETGIVHLAADTQDDGSPIATMLCGRWVVNPDNDATDSTPLTCKRCTRIYLTLT